MTEETKEAMRQERAGLRIEVRDAEQWGAAVTARVERIKAITAALGDE